ncbi:MAG: UDP-3-O-(3-hydroxymyristoyl)glucosamine N-acyltransferase [Synergistaceae bacterium]|nr:UDP-3-O-(3-hydroxymyristoyl)glucosamine N-acyltransferase [Synergistaceae bacterium]
MKEFDKAWKLSQVASYLGGNLVGDPERLVLGVASPEEATSKHICVLWEKRSFKELKEDVPVVVPCNWLEPNRVGVEVKDPKLAFVKLLSLFEKPRATKGEIHPTAVVFDGARVHPRAYVGPLCVVGEGADIAADAVLEAQVFVGKNVHIGEGTVIEPHATIYHDVALGKRCLIHAGVSLGGEGFGFYSVNGKLIKIPQVGGVVIGDDVEIGALTSIDRGTIGNTYIGPGTKIGDCVHIGHNAKIGANCILVAMTGIAGSAVIEDNVIMAAQSGVKDHARIGKGAIIAAKSGVTKDIPPGKIVSGFPARDHREELKIQALTQRLPEMYERLLRLERLCKGVEGEDEEGNSSKAN